MAEARLRRWCQTGRCGGCCTSGAVAWGLSRRLPLRPTASRRMRCCRTTRHHRASALLLSLLPKVTLNPRPKVWALPWRQSQPPPRLEGRRKGELAPLPPRVVQEPWMDRPRTSRTKKTSRLEPCRRRHPPRTPRASGRFGAPRGPWHRKHRPRRRWLRRRHRRRVRRPLQGFREQAPPPAVGESANQPPPLLLLHPPCPSAPPSVPTGFASSGGLVTAWQRPLCRPPSSRRFTELRRHHHHRVLKMLRSLRTKIVARKAAAKVPIQVL